MPYFFALKSLAKLAIFNRGRARRCPLARQLPCELTDPGNFGARLLRGRSIGSVLLFGKAKTQSRTRRGAGVAIEVNRWKWAQIDGRGLAVRGETWIDVRCRGVLFSCRVAVAALCAGQKNRRALGCAPDQKPEARWFRMPLPSVRGCANCAGKIAPGSQQPKPSQAGTALR